MAVTGTSETVDVEYLGVVVSKDFRAGVSQAIDQEYSAPVYGIVIGDTTEGLRDSTFVQNQVLREGDLSLETLRDSTFIDGTSIVDGTHVDSTYQNRLYNPIWTNYSIWSLVPPDGTEAVLQGIRQRAPINPSVGNFYASMDAPDDPGRYKIQWLYQKDSSSFAKAIDEPFSVSSRGIDSVPDYT